MSICNKEISKCNKTPFICNKAPISVTNHLPNVIIHLPNVMYPMLSPTLAPVLASSWGGSRWEKRTWGACWNFLRPSLNSCEQIKQYIIIIYQCTVNQQLFTTKIRPRNIFFRFLGRVAWSLMFLQWLSFIFILKRGKWHFLKFKLL